MAQLHQLIRTSKRSYRRVGRGQGSKRGKTSGRGGKGQTARAGHKVRPELRDIIKKLPKRRGYGKNRGRTVDGTRLDAIAISLSRLDRLFESGSEITSALLKERGILGRISGEAKIVGPSSAEATKGKGEAKKFIIKGIAVSSSARAAIEKAGGQVIV